MPLLANHLPQYDGPYPVSTIDVEHTLENPRLLSPSLQYRYPSDPAHLHPFQLDTILVSIFYPCDKVDTKAKRKSKHPWVPRPTTLQAQGYARAGHMSNFVTDRLFNYALRGLAGSVRISASIDQPLISTGSSSTSIPASISTSRTTSATSATTNSTRKPASTPGNDHLSSLPVLVFSHGMVSTRTNYSHLLATLASHGYIVVAIEHRDGSGPGTIVMPSSNSTSTSISTSSSATSKAYKVPLINEHDLVRHLDRDISLPVSLADFKEAQLSFRAAEIAESISLLSLLNSGHGASIASSNPRSEGATALPTFANRIDLSRAVILGHSFGAVSALKVMKDCPVNGFKGGIAYDPGKESGPLNTEIRASLCIVNSQSWSRGFSLFFGRPHFEVVREIAEGVGGPVTDARKAYDNENDGKGQGERERHLLDREKDEQKRKEDSETAERNGAPCGVGAEMGKQGKRKPAAWFLTSLGTSHASITDAPLIAPRILRWATGSTVDGRDGVQQYVDVTLDFLRWLFPAHAHATESANREGQTRAQYDGSGLDGVDEDKEGRRDDVLRDSILGEGVSHYKFDEDRRNEGTKRRWEEKGWTGKWQVHVAPPR